MARFIAYPRDANRSFPPQTRDTVSAAIDAGFRVGKGSPFDVHRTTGSVAWTWEQRESDSGPSLSPQRAAAFDADKAEVYRALQDARVYVTDFDRNGRKAEALYKRLDRARRLMEPWSTDGTAAQSTKAIEYLNEIRSILSDKIGPASRREFPEQR